MSSVSFASLLCSRLCHDLVSPVGALSNGVEVLAEENSADMRDQVVALLDQSARQTSNRLQFFRLAFGTGGNFGARVDLEHGRAALTAFLESSKIALNWTAGGGELDKSALKLLLNLALVASEALVRGGELGVEVHDGGGTTRLAVVAAGERLTFPDAMRSALEGGLREEDLDPKTAPAYLAYLLAQELPAELRIDASEAETLTLQARLA